MHAVGSRLDDDRCHAAAEAAVLSIVNIGLDGEFLRSAKRWDQGYAAVAFGIGEAVDQRLIFAHPAAVNGDTVDVPISVEFHGTPVKIGLHYAGEGVFQCVEISSVGGDIFQDPVFNGRGACGILCFEQRRFAGHGDPIG